MGDGEAFELFLADEMPRMCRVENCNLKYRDQMIRMEHLFWKWLRCELSHAASLPHDIRFDPDDRPGAIKVSIEKDGTVALSHGWLDALSGVIVAAPENADQFGAPARAPLPIHLPRIGLTVGAAPSAVSDGKTPGEQA